MPKTKVFGVAFNLPECLFHWHISWELWLRGSVHLLAPHTIQAHSFVSWAWIYVHIFFLSHLAESHDADYGFIHINVWRVELKGSYHLSIWSAFIVSGPFSRVYTFFLLFWRTYYYPIFFIFLHLYIVMPHTKSRVARSWKQTSTLHCHCCCSSLFFY